MMRFMAMVCLLAASPAVALAGKYNAVLDIGVAAPAWSDLEGVDGQRHSLADFENKDLVVVVFTCNSCPVATDYEDRILEFSKKYAGPDDRVGLVAINVNLVPEDSLEEMKKRAEAKGFDFPYLFDPSQAIGKAFGAAFTPEFFVLDRERKVIYMGGMDDSSSVDRGETPLSPGGRRRRLGRKATRDGRGPGHWLPRALRPPAAQAGLEIDCVSTEQSWLRADELLTRHNLIRTFPSGR